MEGRQRLWDAHISMLRLLIVSTATHSPHLLSLYVAIPATGGNMEINNWVFENAVEKTFRRNDRVTTEYMVSCLAPLVRLEDSTSCCILNPNSGNL